MAIQGIGQAGVGSIGGAAGPQKLGPTFKKALQAEAAPLRAEPLPPHPHRGVAGQAHAAAPPPAGQQAIAPTRLIDQVAAAQKRMDAVLELAQSGKSFTPAELIALQSQMYRASQELDLAGKVVEKATGGVKQILQTQV